MNLSLLVCSHGEQPKWELPSIPYSILLAYCVVARTYWHSTGYSHWQIACDNEVPVSMTVQTNIVWFTDVLYLGTIAVSFYGNLSTSTCTCTIQVPTQVHYVILCWKCIFPQHPVCYWYHWEQLLLCTHRKAAIVPGTVMYTKKFAQ